MLAAKMAVNAPTTATMVEVSGVKRNNADDRATIYTPAVTMVAAWISAETGVGPSMASGSQTYKGTCADFPVAPKNINTEIALSTPKPAISGAYCPLRSTALTSVNLRVPSTESISSMPNTKPASPTRLTMNAFFPASPADFL